MTDLNGATRETGDPLGFRSAAARSASALVPVVTLSAGATRLYSIFCLLLNAAKTSSTQHVSIRDRFLRLERLWMLAVVRDSHNARDSRLRTGSVFSGGDAAGRLWEAGEPFDLDQPILTRQLSAGLWGRIRRPAAEFGLISGGGPGPEGWQLTAYGSELASAARANVCDPDSRLGTATRWSQVTQARLDGLFEPGWATDNDFYTNAESAVLSRVLHRWDERNDEEFGRLFTSYQRDSRFSVVTVIEGLTPQQRRACSELKALDGLSKGIERPYRHWLRGDDVSLGGSATNKARWEIVECAGDTELAELGRKLRRNCSISMVHRHHVSLAERRGSEPWSRRRVAEGTLTIRPFQPIETRLESLARLFAEGVNPSAGK